MFSSLAKLNVIARGEGNNMNLTVNGQPRLHFAYRTSLPKVRINGKEASQSGAKFTKL